MIAKELIKIGFRPEQTATLYWIESLKNVNKKIETVTDIYIRVAKKFKKTPYAVEKAMTRELKRNEKSIRNYYNYDGKLSNFKFISLFAFYNSYNLGGVNI